MSGTPIARATQQVFETLSLSSAPHVLVSQLVVEVVAKVVPGTNRVFTSQIALGIAARPIPGLNHVFVSQIQTNFLVQSTPQAARASAQNINMLVRIAPPPPVDLCSALVCANYIFTVSQFMPFSSTVAPYTFTLVLGASLVFGPSSVVEFAAGRIMVNPDGSFTFYPNEGFQPASVNYIAEEILVDGSVGRTCGGTITFHPIPVFVYPHDFVGVDPPISECGRVFVCKPCPEQLTLCAPPDTFNVRC